MRKYPNVVIIDPQAMPQVWENSIRREADLVMCRRRWPTAPKLGGFDRSAAEEFEAKE